MAIIGVIKYDYIGHLKVFLDSQDHLVEVQQKYINYRIEVGSVCYGAGASKKGPEGPLLAKEPEGPLLASCMAKRGYPEIGLVRSQAT